VRVGEEERGEEGKTQSRVNIIPYEKQTKEEKKGGRGKQRRKLGNPYPAATGSRKTSPSYPVSFSTHNQSLSLSLSPGG